MLKPIRITSGTHKGKTVQVPKIVEIRPTKDIVKQAIFNILGEKIQKAKIADLYAGSGALGIEALSRGADFCDFVDLNAKAVETIKKNLKTSRLQSRGRVWKEAVMRFLDERPLDYYHIIILDPPYSFTNMTHVFNLCGGCVKKSGVVVLEHHIKFDVKKEYDTLLAVNQRKYGQTAVTFFRKK